MINDIIDITMTLGVALAVAIALVLALAATLHAGKRLKFEPVPYVFYAIIGAMMLLPILTHRVVTSGLGMGDTSEAAVDSSNWAARLATLFVLAVCSERVLRSLAMGGVKRLRGWNVLYAFAGFAITNQIINSFLGTRPFFDHKVIYAFLLFSALFVVAQSDVDGTLRHARNAILMLVIGSLLIAPIKPTMVIDKAYMEGLPGLHFRLHGLAAHANSMGAMCSTLIILLWRYPFASRSVQRLAWWASWFSLLLTQSKTSILALLVILAGLTIYRDRDRLFPARGTARSQLALSAAAGAFMLSGALIVAAVIGGDSVARLFATNDGHQLLTLSGRTQIWAVAWREFLANPLFGYGPSIWNQDFRAMIGMDFAFHAHNQFLQALSAAGLFGFAGLLVYIAVLFRTAIKVAPACGGISVALLALMLVRSMSEVPFATANIVESEIIIQLLVVVICVGHLRRTGWAEQAES